jgi:hypothetical protein
MRETMVTMTEVVRHIASNLRPAALDLGLVAAIEWLAEDFSLRWETRCELQLPRDEEPDLPCPRRRRWPCSGPCKNRSPTSPSMRAPPRWRSC